MLTKLNAVVVLLVLAATITAIWRAEAVKERDPGRYAALWFWGVWWAALIAVWPLMPILPYWGSLCVDLVGASALLAAAYALFKGPSFALRVNSKLDPILAAIAYGMAIGILATVLGGAFVGETNPTWRVIVMSPSLVLAVSTLVALGAVAHVRFEDSEPKLATVVLLCVYAAIQIPAYITFFIGELVPQLANDADLLKLLLAVGKVLILLTFLSLIIPKTKKPTTSQLKVVNALLLTLSIGLGLLGIIMKILGLFGADKVG